MTKEEFKACVYEAFHTNEHWEQFLECVGELYLQATPHWISVEDELPPQNGRYIFYSDTMGVTTSYYYADILLNEHVTHWMPLPQPPAVLSSLESTEKKWEEKKGGEQ